MELIVDNFAGGGGASMGIRKALGVDVDVAINHDFKALGMHAANHRTTAHHVADVFDIDPTHATAGNPVGLAWFSPDCRHFSLAKGAAPVSDSVRGLADVVIRWAETVRPRVISLENVREFLNWGPTENGKPLAARAGEYFERWLADLKAEGYVVEWKILDASDFGAGTLRERLFLIARCDGAPIVWPEPSHGRSGLPAKITAGSSIDWSIPTPNLADRARPLVANTMRRITLGIEKFINGSAPRYNVPGQNASAFIVKYYGTAVGQSLHEPLHTITTKARMALVIVNHETGEIGYRMLKPRELFRAQGFPESYEIERTDTGKKLAGKDQIRMVGNSVSPFPVAALIAANYSSKSSNLHA